MLLDLYERAFNEKDPDKRRLLVEEIFRLIEEQQQTAGPKANLKQKSVSHQAAKDSHARPCKRPLVSSRRNYLTGIITAPRQGRRNSRRRPHAKAKKRHS